MRAITPFLVILVTAACGARQAGGSEDLEQDGMSLAEPDWSSCVEKGEVETCAQACELEGMECVANGCPADPEFCDPEPCDMATQLLGLNEPLLCGDEPAGGWVASSCDAPIEWLLSSRLRCCCAQPN